MGFNEEFYENIKKACENISDEKIQQIIKKYLKNYDSNSDYARENFYDELIKISVISEEKKAGLMKEPLDDIDIIHYLVFLIRDKKRRSDALVDYYAIQDKIMSKEVTKNLNIRQIQI